MKILLAILCGWKDGQRNRETDMAKIRVGIHNFANRPRN